MVLINADFMLGNRDVQWAQALHVVAQGRDLVSKFLTSAHIAQLGEDELKDTLSHDLKLVDEWDGQSQSKLSELEQKTSGKFPGIKSALGA